MRILTSLLLIMLLSTAGAQTKVSSVEDLSINKTYTIYNPHFTAYAIFSPADHGSYLWAAEMTGDESHSLKDVSYSLPFDSRSPYSAWMMVQYNNEWYVYNVGAQMFLNVGVTGGRQATILQTEPIPVIINSDNGYFTFLTTEGNRNYMCAAPQMNYPVSVWSAEDSGAQWQIEENAYVPADYETCLSILKDKVKLTGDLTIITRNGNLYSNPSGKPLPNKVVLGQPLNISAQTLSGYTCPQGVVVRHGHNLSGPQYVGGEQQWREYAMDAKLGITTIPADSIDGDVMLTAIWERNSDNADVLVFSDEFDSEGEPSCDWWLRTPRARSTWNRWCSDDPRVVYQQGGALHCLAIPTPSDITDDDVPMLTGGIKSQGLFTFQYGRAEARIKTNPWRGNFPAFWMMPADNSAGWPNAGEIDIWEAIDATTQSWHTIHTNWTYNLHQGTNSQTYNNLDYSLWHTYAVDWNANSITWYVDGQRVWSYTKSTDDNALSNGQWPFDAPFYLILNQSVGNGSWAANADTNHTYETLFDWVRVYQPVSITGIENFEQDTEGRKQSVYDLQGRKISHDSCGVPYSRLPKGIYIINGKKTVVR